MVTLSAPALRTNALEELRRPAPEPRRADAPEPKKPAADRAAAERDVDSIPGYF